MLLIGCLFIGISIGRRGQKTGQYLNLHVLCTSVRNCNVYCSYNSFHQKYLCQPYKIITTQLSWKNPKRMYFNYHWKSHWIVQMTKDKRKSQGMYSENCLDVSQWRLNNEEGKVWTWVWLFFIQLSFFFPDLFLNTVV